MPLESPPAPSLDQASLDEASLDEDDSFLRAAACIPERASAPRARQGDRIGRFLVEAEIGRGGMGVVYRARDPALSREVALKLLPAERLDDERKRRFLREARAAARVRHPAVAGVFEAGDEGGQAFLAMELIEGETLRARLARSGALPPREAARLARELALGLDAAHRAGVVHRDIKPENVMVTAEGSVKILDFGLAKAPLAGPSGEGASVDLATREGHLLGTPSYMSPEQTRGRDVGPASDVFSLGVVLYELLSGERPFQGETAIDVMSAIGRDAPRPLGSRRAPRSLDALVRRCLDKSPSARPSARSLAEQLEPFLHPRPSPPRAPLLALAAALLALGAVAALRAPAGHGESPRAIAPAPPLAPPLAPLGPPSASPGDRAEPPPGLAPPGLAPPLPAAARSSPTAAPSGPAASAGQVIPSRNGSPGKHVDRPQPAVDPLEHQK